MMIPPPSRPSIASEALVTRFMTTWRSCAASPSTVGSRSPSSYCNWAFLQTETSSNRAVSRTSAPRSIGSTMKRPLPE